MKKGVKLGLTVIGCAVFLTAICIYSIPKLRVSLFVSIYHELIEESLATGNGVPADDAVLLGYDAVNSWDGTHPMTEFLIMAVGNSYYGCYYSPDDIPLAFQNADVEIMQDGHDYWEWYADGDNHGSTSKIMECWYFFKASF